MYDGAEPGGEAGSSRRMRSLALWLDLATSAEPEDRALAWELIEIGDADDEPVYRLLSDRVDE